jgi:hypothetical protein
VADVLLCAKEQGATYHRLACIKGECLVCGVEKLFKRCPKESARGRNHVPHMMVRWERFEDVAYLRRGGEEGTKVKLVWHEGHVSELYKEIKDTLL